MFQIEGVIIWSDIRSAQPSALYFLEVHFFFLDAVRAHSSGSWDGCEYG